MGAYAAMQFLFGPVMGGLGDRFGRRPVILLSMLAFGLDYLVMGLSPTYGFLFVSRAIAGITGASFRHRHRLHRRHHAARAARAELRPDRRRLRARVHDRPGHRRPARGLGPRAPFFAAAGLALLNATAAYFHLPESLPAERRRPFHLVRANPLGTFASLARHRGARPLFVAWFLWMLAHQAYPATWAFFTKLKFGWSDRAVGASLAYSGFMLALMQTFVTRRLVPAIGERRSILFGLSVGMVGFRANALVPQG